MDIDKCAKNENPGSNIFIYITLTQRMQGWRQQQWYFQNVAESLWYKRENSVIEEQWALCAKYNGNFRLMQSSQLFLHRFSLKIIAALMLYAI